VLGSAASDKLEIFSGVPQGAKLSPKLWNFDIRDMPAVVGGDATFMSYADDCNLWFPLGDCDRANPDAFIALVNTVLQRLSDWGLDSHTTFEPTKMAMMVSLGAELLLILLVFNLKGFQWSRYPPPRLWGISLTPSSPGLNILTVELRRLGLALVL
jgi:hypothetical protein